MKTDPSPEHPPEAYTETAAKSEHTLVKIEGAKKDDRSIIVDNSPLKPTTRSDLYMVYVEKM